MAKAKAIEQILAIGKKFSPLSWEENLPEDARQAFEEIAKRSEGMSWEAMRLPFAEAFGLEAPGRTTWKDAKRRFFNAKK